MRTVVRPSPAAVSLLLAVLLLLPGVPVAAQQAAAVRAEGWHTLRIAKWSTLALSAGAAVYGLVANERADDLYRELEQACVADPVACRDRTPDGAYRSPDLEQRYQRVLDRDRGARAALLASQVGVAATVVLFILDLRNAGPPDDVIYEPRPIELAPARGGGVELRLRLPAP